MFKNVRISTRLVAANSLLILLILVVAGIGYWGISSFANQIADMLGTDARLAEHRARTRANTLNLRRFEKDVFLNIGAPDKVDDYWKKWNDQLERTEKPLNCWHRMINGSREPALFLGVTTRALRVDGQEIISCCPE